MYLDMAKYYEVKRDGSSALMNTPASRRKSRPLIKTIVGNAKTPLQHANSNYADWVIVSIHGLKTDFNLPNRQLLDVLREMPGSIEFLHLETFGTARFYHYLIGDPGAGTPI